jgi:hypothetical protein
MTKNKIEAITNEKKAIMAATEVKLKQLDKAIQSLLAIEMK